MLALIRDSNTNSAARRIEGITARARAEGRVGGNRAKLTPKQQIEALKILATGDRSQSEVAEIIQVHRSTISRLASEARVLARK